MDALPENLANPLGNNKSYQNGKLNAGAWVSHPRHFEFSWLSRKMIGQTQKPAVIARE
jgi:hypothetical protein